MTISFADLLTPIRPVQSGRPTSDVGSLGEMLVQRAAQQAQAEEKQREFGITSGLSAEEIRGKNRYYDAQADTHRMLAEDKNKGDIQKRVNSLIDTYMKAKAKGDQGTMQDVRNQLQTLGHTVTEEPSDLPGTATADTKPAGVVPEELAPVDDIKPQKRRGPVDKKFQGDLAEYMATREPGASPDVQQSSAPPGVVPPELVGEGLPPQPKAEKPKPAGGGKFVVRNAQGDVVLSYDQPLERQKTVSNIEGMLAPYQGDTSNAVHRAAAEKAAAAAAPMVDTLGGQAAMLAAQKLYEKEVAEFKKTYPKGKGGAASGKNFSKEDRIRLGDLGNVADKIINDVKTTRKYSTITDDDTFANEAEALLKMDSGPAQTIGVKKLIQRLNGRNSSDKEASAILESGGFWPEAEHEFNKFTNEGRLAPEFVDRMREVMASSKTEIVKRKEEAAQVAYDFAMTRSMPATDEERSTLAHTVKRFFSGERLAHPGTEARPTGKPGAGPKEAPKPAATDENRKDALDLLGGEK